jgi:hypothetical protein
LPKFEKGVNIERMVSKDAVTLLQKAIEENKKVIDICLQDNISVICINRETKKDRHMPFSAMYGNNTSFWMKIDSWEYFRSWPRRAYAFLFWYPC